MASSGSLGLMLGLSACKSTPKHLLPVSDEAQERLADNGVMAGSPLYVRVFKKEEEMELWLHSPYGYVPFKTYKICSWSGGLGPKLKTGDKQAPEGFYMVSASQMNPNSKYHLSFNLGYPNASDRAHRRTGAHLMVHGGCSSAGCYAITDEQVQEIFSLARDSFKHGENQFPVHAFPFRMTKANMKAHKAHKWYDFWVNLKQGYDHFEKHRRPPVVGVKNKRYVFFDTPADVPEQFRISAASGRDHNQPRLVSGWGVKTR
jgi:murein L,D-transpeptidase YafK